ncbi:DUF6527 family protein [Actinomadura geliboluensis]
MSLDPSIGNWSLPCRSHYGVRRGRVQQAAPNVGSADQRRPRPSPHRRREAPRLHPGHRDHS